MSIDGLPINTRGQSISTQGPPISTLVTFESLTLTLLVMSRFGYGEHERMGITNKKPGKFTYMLNSNPTTK